ncbi:uncharacterized protein BDZ99DRAFT_385390 [Mytilinidion resinicola]|uniref:Aminoglycoside phosphotransferase domain-containing protein n=1 Tax=Mytilinidion resinicola TaxID=574789 RepID=A0A6A6YSL8_9PEZI|nr:uncharacterized protein BDZ99DRAFT_385390 [Mytilinidion resinicola]KAF2811044.1 hypothetical protein BDZ99DRAFT_385390 [Mytilinidion resinicola]
MSQHHDFEEELHVLPPPPSVHIPTGEKLTRLCTEEVMGYSKHLAYPTRAPQLWIKYGCSVLRNEVPAQMMAYHGLQQLQSPVRVPKVYYTCRYMHVSYIVMEYIPGKTMGQLLKEHPTRKQDICNLVAFGLQELLRIPVPPDARPAGIDGGAIRHPLFDDSTAPLDYQNVSELDTSKRGNPWIRITRQSTPAKNLAYEPMVFCYGDIWPENFILDLDRRLVTIIDFAIASILPSSFAKHALRSVKIDVNLDELVKVPTTDGVDNFGALCSAQVCMVQGAGSFAPCGRRILGRPKVPSTIPPPLDGW